MEKNITGTQSQRRDKEEHTCGEEIHWTTTHGRGEKHPGHREKEIRKKKEERRETGEERNDYLK